MQEEVVGAALSDRFDSAFRVEEPLSTQCRQQPRRKEERTERPGLGWSCRASIVLEKSGRSQKVNLHDADQILLNHDAGRQVVQHQVGCGGVVDG